MYIIKNAWKNITRNKGRNILIGIIIVVIATATAVTLAISNSSDKLIKAYEDSSEVEATISVNRENMRSKMKPSSDEEESFTEEKKEELSKNFKSASSISEEEIKTYGDSEYVKEYYYTVSLGVNGGNIEKVSSGSSDSNRGGMTGGFPGGGKFQFGNMSSSDFTLVGYSTKNSMSDFISGKYQISDGSVFEDFEGNYCVINAELADANNLKVGDSITVTDPNNEENTLTLEITGIYEEKETTQENAMSMFTGSANQIITNSTVVSNFATTDEELSTSTTPTFILTSKDVIDNFSEELTEKGLSEYLTVSTNLEKVESATSTISNVKSFSTTFLILTLLIGGIVLFVINMINIRERKYEIGVLRTIGMKKSILASQFIAELLIISLFALAVGTGIGSAISMPISNSLLQNEINSSKEQVENVNRNFGPGNGGGKGDFPMMNAKDIGGVASVQAYDSIDAVVDFKVILELIGVGVLLTLVSSASSIMAIERFQPLEILKERS